MAGPRRRARVRRLTVDGNGTTELGLSIMAAMSVASVHSSLAPSLFTFQAFSRKPEEQAIARRTLYISLGASLLTSLGIYLIFKRFWPAVVGAGTAFALFGLGMYAAHSDSGPESPTMEPARMPYAEGTQGRRGVSDIGQGEEELEQLMGELESAAIM